MRAADAGHGELCSGLQGGRAPGVEGGSRLRECESTCAMVDQGGLLCWKQTMMMVMAMTTIRRCLGWKLLVFDE